MNGAFEGKSVIVTGAGAGIGRAAARRLAGQGARLVLSDSDADMLEETRELVAAEGEPPRLWRCELRDKLGVANLVAYANDRLPRIDILINASLIAPIGDPLALTLEDLDRAMTANLSATFALSQSVARLMIETRPAEGEAGAIVNLTSIAARITAPELLPFSVSCAARDQLTRSMAAALAPEGVRVNAVATGAVMTRELRDAIRETRPLREAILRATPMGRIAEADEAAEAVLFLAGRRASFITGSTLTVDGGRSTLDPLAAQEPVDAP